MKQTSYSILFLLFFTIMAHAQELTVKSFTTSTDVDASVHRVNDLNGQACALVKVLVTDEVTGAKGASVINQEGNQSVTKHGSNEYWVYLAKGARHLTVATQNHLPLKINFQDYGITTLEGLRTYVLQLNANKQAEKQRLTIKYSPSDAVVLIDSKVCQGQNGTYQTSLAPGNYKVVVTHSGYNPFDITAEIKNSPVSLFAYLEKIDAQEETVTPQAAITPQPIAPPHNTSISQATTTSASSASNTSYGNASSDASQTFTVGGVSFKMIKVDGGSFTMGATSEQGSKADSDESPTHRVTLSTYYIGETEVTQALWEAVMENNPSNRKGASLPVEMVSWEDCQNFVRKLNQMTGKNFRLPTEAEWEFAARGGTKSAGYKYSGSNSIDDVAWYWKNSGDHYLSGTDDDWDWEKIEKNNCKPHIVKTKSPNELGIYDMSGNVWEWCEVLYNSSGSGHVVRGGSWLTGVGDCFVSRRSYNARGIRGDILGLRLAL